MVTTTANNEATQIQISVAKGTDNKIQKSSIIRDIERNSHCKGVKTLLSKRLKKINSVSLSTQNWCQARIQFHDYSVGVYRTFAKLNNTSHKENLNKKNLKFLLPLKRRYFWPEENIGLEPKKKRERNVINIVHSWSPRCLGVQGRMNGNELYGQIGPIPLPAFSHPLDLFILT